MYACVVFPFFPSFLSIQIDVFVVFNGHFVRQSLLPLFATAAVLLLYDILSKKKKNTTIRIEHRLL